jgi:trigger factor
MKVTQEKRPASQVEIGIEIPPERLKRAYEQVIQKFTREFNIPGFRKGKVPRQVLVQRFGDRRLKATALEDLLNQTIQQAIEQEKLQTIGEFSLVSSFDALVDQFSFQEPITFSVLVDVQPEVILHQYQGFTVKAEEVKPDLTRVDSILDNRRREIATLIPIEDRPAELGDIAIVDFTGRLAVAEGAELTAKEQEAQEFLQRETTDFQIDMVDDRFIPGFVEGIVGMVLEETREIAVQFPETYIQEALAGISAIFTVTLKELKARELPELNDEFAQEVSEFATLAELRAFLEKQILEEAEEKTKINKENALVDALLQYVDVDLPATMVNREMDYLLEQSSTRLRNQGLSMEQVFTSEQIQAFRQELQPEAVNRLKQRLALREIAKREAIEVDPEKLAATMREYLSSMRDYKVDPELLQIAVREDLSSEKVLEWIEAHSTVELVPEGTLSKPDDLSSETTEETNGEAELDASNVELAAEPIIPEPAATTAAVIDDAAAESIAETLVADSPVVDSPATEEAESTPPVDSNQTADTSADPLEEELAEPVEPAPKKKRSKAKSKSEES